MRYWICTGCGGLKTILAAFGLCIAAGLFCVGGAVHADWPQWMGPNLDGIIAKADFNTEWATKPPEQLWTQEIGIGFSSVSIVDNRLYTMGNTSGTEAVYCFDALSGKEIWRHSYPCQLVAVLYEGGPGCTPTVDGDRVYVTGKEGQLKCLDCSTGNIIWEVNLQSELGVVLPEWGFNASPMISGDKLYVEVGRLACFEKSTGKLIWQTEKHNSGYGSVRQMKFGDQELLVTLDCDGLRFNQLADGKQLAFEKWKSPFRTNSTTPIIHKDTVFVSTGYNVGCGLFRLSKSDDGSLALNEVYANREMRNHFNNSILLNGNIYGFDGNSNLGRVVQLKCIDHLTGELKWTQRGFGCGSLMVAGDNLLILSDDGRLALAKASPEKFELLGEVSILNGRCWTVPVIQESRVYARNARGKLVCFELGK